MGGTKFVYDFNEGNKDMKDLLGGQAPTFVNTTTHGLPVPPGDASPTEVWMEDDRHSRYPEGLTEESDADPHRIQRSVGERRGAERDPPLIYVKSGVKFSMPG